MKETHRASHWLFRFWSILLSLTLPAAFAKNISNPASTARSDKGSCLIENKNDFARSVQSKQFTTDCGMSENDFEEGGLNLLLAQALPGAARKGAKSVKRPPPAPLHPSLRIPN